MAYMNGKEPPPLASLICVIRDRAGAGGAKPAAFWVGGEADAAVPKANGGCAEAGSRGSVLQSAP